MFERFTEAARHCLFFARARTVERDGDSITNEDLLAGIGLAAPAILSKLASDPGHLVPKETADEFLRRAEQDHTSWQQRAGREIRFSTRARDVLTHAAQEADSLGHREIEPAHLLLGLLRAEGTDAWRTLQEAGVILREVRKQIQGVSDGRRPPGGV